MQVTYFSNLPARVDHLVRLLETQPLQLRQVWLYSCHRVVGVYAYECVYDVALPSDLFLSILMTLNRTRT